MGCSFSKGIALHEKADASVAPAPTTSHHHDTDINKCHNPAHQSSSPAITSRPRRNSPPVSRMADSAAADGGTTQQQDISTAQPAPSQPAPPPTEPIAQCLICCTDLSGSGDNGPLRPCRGCNSAYCAACVAKMFIEACKDSTRMPPRCCSPINIQHAKPHLTQDEAELFRAKYEEWCTPDPVYCPVPVCSAFIPDRLLPHQLKTNKKRRVDLTAVSPATETFACPTCAAGICTACRQQAHPGAMCNEDDFGLDRETIALLKSWGYKNCPKCGHGVKKMFGCNSMQCRCGAQFCWACLGQSNECDEACYDEYDLGEEDEEEEDDDDDDDEEEEEEDGEFDEVVINRPDMNTETVTVDASTQALQVAVVPRSPRAHNLDGGGPSYWESTGFDFGEEPEEAGPGTIWTCRHSFDPYTLPFSDTFTPHDAEMECVKCWKIIHPGVSASISTNNSKQNIAPVVHSRSAAFGVRGGRNRASPQAQGCGRGRRGYAPPRGLFRANTTIGTAPHLSTTVQTHLPSLPARDPSPMEDVQLSEHGIDRYGKTITTSPAQRSRRDSPASSHTPLTGKKHQTTPSVLDHSPNTFSLAHECRFCFAIVCGNCKNLETAAQEADDERYRRRTEAEEDR